MSDLWVGIPSVASFNSISLNGQLLDYGPAESVMAFVLLSVWASLNLTSAAPYWLIDSYTTGQEIYLNGPVSMARPAPGANPG